MNKVFFFENSSEFDDKKWKDQHFDMNVKNVSLNENCGVALCSDPVCVQMIPCTDSAWVIFRDEPDIYEKVLFWALYDNGEITGVYFDNDEGLSYAKDVSNVRGYSKTPI